MFTAVLFLLLCCCEICKARIAQNGYVPLGVNDLLYDPKTDPIIQLDQYTFDDTIHCLPPRNDCTAFVVEFYADWCGECRRFAPLYKELASQIVAWDKVVRLAAVNCGDPLNLKLCFDNHVLFYPSLYYYNRYREKPVYTKRLKDPHTVDSATERISDAVMADFEKNRYGDWPLLDFIDHRVEKVEDLWINISSTVPYLMLVIEQSDRSLVGAKVALDTLNSRNKMAVLRATKNHSLAKSFNFEHIPTFVIFKRNNDKPEHVNEIHRLFTARVQKFLNDKDLEGSDMENRTQDNSSVWCEQNPEKCREKFVISETDMLKALHYATFNAVIMGRKFLNKHEMIGLIKFLDFIIKNMPRETIYPDQATPQTLKSSVRAKAVFIDVKKLLETKLSSNELCIKNYSQEFRKFEAQKNKPFPVGSEWVHCAGSKPEFRGLTCGLWTSFHALTMQAYKNGANATNKSEWMEPVLAISAWVENFFSCRQCRDHFIQMTTQTFPAELHIRQPEDVFMYLWEAHNIVNARLQNDSTEDPEFPKVQFPASFLCPNCWLPTSQHFDYEAIKNFLLIHYTKIRPVS